jgi:hypothetical protein
MRASTHVAMPAAYASRSHSLRRPWQLPPAAATPRGPVGIDLALHQQGIDTTTPADKAMFQMSGRPGRNGGGCRYLVRL